MFEPSIQPQQQVYALAEPGEEDRGDDELGYTGIGTEYGREAVREGLLGGSARAGISVSIPGGVPLPMYALTISF